MKILALEATKDLLAQETNNPNYGAILIGFFVLLAIVLVGIHLYEKSRKKEKEPEEEKHPTLVEIWLKENKTKNNILSIVYNYFEFFSPVEAVIYKVNFEKETISFSLKIPKTNITKIVTVPLISTSFIIDQNNQLQVVTVDCLFYNCLKHEEYFTEDEKDPNKQISELSWEYVFQFLNQVSMYLNKTEYDKYFSK